MPAVPISKCCHNTSASNAASALTNNAIGRAFFTGTVKSTSAPISGIKTAKTAGASGGLIDSRIDAVLIDTGRKNSKELTDPAKSAHQAIPELAVHPVGQTRTHPTERDDRASIKFIDPHFILEESK